MNCLIVDDNPMARLALRQMTEDIPILKEVYECENAKEAYQFLKQNTIDLLLLDVEMPEMSGLELVQNLAAPPTVIIITSKRDYAVDAFDLHVADYIVKPVTFSRLLAAIERIASESVFSGITSTSYVPRESMFARINNMLTRIDLKEILFLQALGDYVTIITSHRKYPVHITLKGILEKLPEGQFAQTHRSYIVAINKIDGIEDNMIMIGKHQVPISESFKSSLMRNLNLI